MMIHVIMVFKYLQYKNIRGVRVDVFTTGFLLST